MSQYINEIRYNTKNAENFFAEKLAFTLGPVELKEMIKKAGVKLIDVRRKEDYDEAHIPEAVSIPKDELAAKLLELSTKDLHILCCYNQQCHMAAAAALILAKNGYPVMELEGGFKVWADDFGFEVIKS